MVQSPNLPVIGVGESTTSYFPSFLHNELRLDRRQFYAEVQPCWKAGVRFEWGLPGEHHFNYSFDFMMNQEGKGLRLPPGYHCLESLDDVAHYSAIMDRGISPLSIVSGHYHFQEGTGYHLDNKKFLAYLDRKAPQLGVEMISGDVQHAPRRENGDVDHLQLAGGRRIEADLFIDCSGFESFLLEKTMGEKFKSYRNALFSDAAVIGSWQRDDEILPYTRAETYDHGWCWQIEFLDHVTRGYVYSSQFCDEETATEELLAKNPRIEGAPKVVRFRSGRYENYWR